MQIMSPEERDATRKKDAKSLSISSVNDMLKFDAINALPHPLTARFFGGDEWQVHDIDVQTGLMQIYVGGLIQNMDFCEVIALIDIEGDEHDADSFWHE